MVEATPPKTWSPLGIARRFQALIRQPGDLSLTLQIAAFMRRTPREIEREPLPEVLDRIRQVPRRSGLSIDAQVERIARLRRPWFGLPALRGHDTCYVRALTLYRFLDPGTGDLRIHFVVEPTGSDERLRGHAWVTWNGALLEEPAELEAEGRTRGLYSHPPDA